VSNLAIVMTIYDSSFDWKSND